MIEFISKIWEMLKGLLPGSPIKAVIGDQALQSDWLSTLKWFFPVAECIALLEFWLLCIVAYYIISAILRYFRIIS